MQQAASDPKSMNMDQRLICWEQKTKQNKKTQNKTQKQKSFTVLIEEHFNQAGWIRRSTSCFLPTNKNPS
jgi:hypothetical protein